jgi:hypothetical protein|tara:strand:+ start:24790 stop:25362 length:573 start_codon:yes stop_codon:yes gene_type:complete
MPWVYDRLVAGSDDIPGQFAYLYYKSEKRKLAASLKTSGKTDAEILETLKNYQQNLAADTAALAKFRAEGEKVLKHFLEVTEQKTLAEADTNFAKKHQEIGQAVRDLDKLVGQKRGPGQRFLSWLLIGMRSWLSTAIWGMIIGGLLLSLAWLVAPQGTEEAAKGFWDKAMDGLSHFIDCQKSSAPPECRE